MGQLIRESEASTRLGNMPFRTDIFDRISVADVLTGRTRDEDLLAAPEFGKTTLRELRALLETYAAGLAVGQDPLSNDAVADLQSDPVDDFSDRERTIEQAPARESATTAINALSERDKFVLTARYGLDGTECLTLDEIGRKVFVTRERVRQVEKKAIRALSKRPSRKDFQRLLADERDVIWDALAGSDVFVPNTEVNMRSGNVDPLVRLAFDVVDDGPRRWLERVATNVPGGWLAPGASAAALADDVAVLSRHLTEFPLPRPFSEVCFATGLDKSRATLALEMVPGYRIHAGYLHQGHFGAKARRAARLHRLAMNATTGNIIDAWRLAALDAADSDSGGSSPRMVLVQLVESTHLFSHLFDQYWVVLPACANWSGNADGVPPPACDDLDPGFDTESLSHWIYETLAREGPMRHVDLRDRAVREVAGIAGTSVGPMLQMHPVFHRVAPGVYDVRRPRPWGPDTPTSMLSIGQCRTYARARRSGAAQIYFSGWTGEFEWRLCAWARESADGDVFRSLLSSSDPTLWPAPRVSSDRVATPQTAARSMAAVVRAAGGARKRAPHPFRISGCAASSSCVGFDWMDRRWTCRAGPAGFTGRCGPSCPPGCGWLCRVPR